MQSMQRKGLWIMACPSNKDVSRKRRKDRKETDKERTGHPSAVGPYLI